MAGFGGTDQPIKKMVLGPPFFRWFPAFAFLKATECGKRVSLDRDRWRMLTEFFGGGMLAILDPLTSVVLIILSVIGPTVTTSKRAPEQRRVVRRLFTPCAQNCE